MGFVEKEVRQIGLLLQTNWEYGRGIMRGVIQYGNIHGPWRFHKLGVPVGGEEVARPAVSGIVGHVITVEVEAYLRTFGVPVVNVSGLSAAVKLPRVTPDNVATGAMGAEHLCEQGHRRLLFLGPADHRYAHQRWEGFSRAAKKRRVEARVAFLEGYFGEEELRSVLEGWGLPIGIMCANDFLAASVLRHVQGLGLRVPEQVAVMGVDNDDVFCELAVPSLTSVALGTENVGMAAGEVLDRLMRGEKVEEEVTTRPSRVVVRGSSNALAVGDEDLAASLAFIRGHIQEGIQVKHLLDHVAMSRRTLEKKFMELLGRSPAEEIRRVRMERVKSLLSETQLGMDAVARASGFRNAKELAKSFKLQVGKTPVQYRNEVRGVWGQK